ncbi:diguanylate phosphodiesterase, partial [Methylobacterium brachiatum]
MVPVLGRYAGLLAAGLLALVVLGPLAVFAPLMSALALGGLAAVAAGIAQARTASLKARCEKLSGEVDLLSRRLLKAETAAVPPRPEAGDAALRAEVEELTVELGLLSGIVRDLTTVVSTQDSEIASLKARPEPRPELPPAAVPEPAQAQTAPEPEGPALTSRPHPIPPAAPSERIPAAQPLTRELPPEPAPAPRPIPPPPVARAPPPRVESQA